MSKKKRRKIRPAASTEAPPALPAAEPSTRIEAGLSLAIAAVMAVLIVVRPWRDGYAFPLSNYYFLWASAAILVVWAGGVVLFSGRFVRAPGSILLGLFLLAAILTGLDTVQQDGTLRALLHWSAALFIFLAAANGLRTRTAALVVAGAFIVAMAIEAGYGVLHLKYLLPITRQSLIQDPTQLETIFNVSQLSPELAHRINVNRAFGHFLFPNALAAFMIMGVPVAVAGAGLALARLRALRAGSEPAPPRMQYAFLAGLASWAVVMTPALVGIFRLGLDVSAGLEDVASMRNWIVWIAIVPAAAGLGVGAVIYARRSELPPKRQYATLVGLVAWAATLGVCFIAYSFEFLSRYEYSAWLERPLGWVFWVGLIPLAAGVAFALVAAAKGPVQAWYWGLSAVLCAASLLGLYALWLTFSRGGLLGLAAAGGWCGALLLLRKRNGRRVKPRAGAAAAAALGAGALLLAAAGGGSDGTEAPAQAPSAAEAGAAGGAQAGSQGPAIKVQGQDLALTDAADPTSLRLRLSYWKTGMRMFADHPFTGVGLGNFGVAYPAYQYLGAGDVQAAHNDYIQVLCETGVLGFAAFVAFWGYFIVLGARRVLREGNRRRLGLFIGLYCGAIAFLAHCMVDFNFYNPTLAWLQFALAGACLAVIPAQPLKVRSRLPHQVAAIPLIVVASLAAGFGVKIWAAERFQGPENLTATRINAAARLMSREPRFEPQRLPAWQDVYSIVRDLEVLSRTCSLWQPMGDARRGITALRMRGPRETPERGDLVMVRQTWRIRRSLWESQPKLMEQFRRGKSLFTSDEDTPPIPVWSLRKEYGIPTDEAKQYGRFVRTTESGLQPVPEGEELRYDDLLLVTDTAGARQAVYRYNRHPQLLARVKVIDALFRGTTGPAESPQYAVVSQLAPRGDEGEPEPGFVHAVRDFAELWRGSRLEDGRVMFERLGPEDEPALQDFVVADQPSEARRSVERFAQHWIGRLETADGRFQAQLAGLAKMAPETSRLLFEWYDVLAGALSGSDSYRDYVLQSLRWAEEFAERSPWDARARQYLGKALWRRGNLEGEEGRMIYYERGLQAYRKAAELYPTSPVYATQYAESLERFGNALVELGEATGQRGEVERGREYLERSQAWMRKARELREAQALPLQERLAL